MLKAYLNIMKIAATVFVLYKSMKLGLGLDLAILDGVTVYALWAPFGKVE